MVIRKTVIDLDNGFTHHDLTHTALMLRKLALYFRSVQIEAPLITHTKQKSDQVIPEITCPVMCLVRTDLTQSVYAIESQDMRVIIKSCST